jgi:hypothetical protein
LQWQLGRILRQQNQLKEAIAAYSQFCKYLTISSSRISFVLTPDLPVFFTGAIEPVYRGILSALSLQFSPDQNNLKQARELTEALQLAELIPLSRSLFKSQTLNVLYQIRSKSGGDSTGSCLFPSKAPFYFITRNKIPQSGTRKGNRDFT